MAETMSEKQRLTQEIARLEKEIAAEVIKGDACLKDCENLKGLVHKVMTTKSSEGVDITLPSDSEDEAPRRRRKADKEKEASPKTSPKAQGSSPKASSPKAKGSAPSPKAEVPAAPAPKPATKEELAATALRKKLREAKTQADYSACKAEAERLGLKHEAQMAGRKIG